MDSSEQQCGRLALADGAIFRGRVFGSVKNPGRVTAEVVFNTAMSGYQEALTDPSYAGQILVMTSPMVGVYGVNGEDVESGGIQVAGFVVRELVERASNHRAASGLSEALEREGVPGLEGIDTRALTRRLREHGAMAGVLCWDPGVDDAALVKMAGEAGVMEGRDLASDAGALEAWSLGEKEEAGGASWLPGSESGRGLTVIALDCGIKRNILRHLESRGCVVRVVPMTTGAKRLREMFETGEADGLFVSNGPGDPAALEGLIGTLRELVGSEQDETGQIPPIFGICLGCQLLALAVGAETYKMKFGHRGVNQPVLNKMTGRIEITSQNHGFAVEAGSLERVGGEVTHIHLNDQTLAGFRMTDRPMFAVQYHPESSPGPHDAAYLFDLFVKMMRDRRPVSGEGMGGAARAGVSV